MAKSKFFSTSSKVAAALTVGLMGVGAQEALAQSGEEEIVVTGSNIRGTPEDAALPVDVITSQTLEQQGAPTVVQLVRTVTAAAASFGEGYRHGGAPPGAATVNLRGLGGQRTLVLMNGRRFAASVPLVAGNGVDLNLLPTAAIGRVEILRDGAAAVYGSDAVAGVVNFITRRDLEGFQVGGEYTAIDGSDGDYRADASYGWQGDRGNILASFAYRHRSVLLTQDRDWALRPSTLPSSGGWSTASNPGGYFTTPTGASAVDGSGNVTDPLAFTPATSGGTGISFMDPGCAAVGGQVVSGACRFQYSRFESLTNPEDAYQVYFEANYELADDLDFHSEVAWFRRTSEQRVSPVNQTAQFPSPIVASGASPGGGTSPFPAQGSQAYARGYYIPRDNPGLDALIDANCDGVGDPTWCAGADANGVLTSGTGWRAMGPGGNLLYSDGADRQWEEVDGFRASAGLTGMMPWDIRWNGAVTWSDIHRHQSAFDLSISRLQLALLGLGGPDCDPDTDSPGDPGCLWLNPFSNSLGAANGNNVTPQTSNAALRNSPDLVRWMNIPFQQDTTFQNLTGDLTLDGALPIELGGGPIQWAAGVQYRYDRIFYNPSSTYDLEAVPCPDSPPFGDGTPACSSPIGGLIFFTPQTEYDVDRISKAVYVEVRAPITDGLEVSAALRHEVFGDLDTTDPRISVRWQALPWIALRASAGSTFRSPPQEILIETATRGLANFSSLGAYRPVDLFGNADLEPETADTWSAGFIVNTGNFRASVDYFDYAFQGELTTESATSLQSNFYSASPLLGVALADRCTSVHPTIVELRSRINFAGGVCSTSPANFLGIQRYHWINGPDIDTSGVDFSASYDFDDVFGGGLTVGVDGTWLNEYALTALTSPFLPGLTITPAIDRAGYTDGLTRFYSYPEWKANAFVNFSTGPVNVRWTTHYTHETTDIGFGVGAVPAASSQFPVDAFISHDLTVQWEVMNSTLTFNVANLADEDPPYDPVTQYNYAPFVSDIVGRTIEIGFKTRF